jgi:hypothetical protein
MKENKNEGGSSIKSRLLSQWLAHVYIHVIDVVVLLRIGVMKILYVKNVIW